MRPITTTISSVAASEPIRVNWRGGRGGFSLSLAVALNPGVLTYTVEHTFDDPEDFASSADYGTNALWFATGGLTSASATDEGNISFPVQAVRLNVTAYTSGSAELTIAQGE